MTRRKTNHYREKGQALFLTVLMVLSVVAMSAAFVGTAVAVEEDDIAFGPTQVNSTTIEVTFDSDVSHVDEDNFTVWDWEGEEITVNDAQVDATNDRRVTIDLNDELVGGEAYLELLPAGENVSIQTTSTTADLAADDEIGAHAGEQVAIVGVLGDVVDITDPDGDTIQRGMGDNSTVRALDTSGWSAGDVFHVESTLGTGEVNITLTRLDYDVELDEDEFGEDENITGTVESNLVGTEFVVGLMDEDGERIAHDVADTGSEGDYDFDLGTADEGNYTVQVNDLPTWISAESDEFSVVEVVVDEFQITAINDAEQERGDIVQIDLDVENVEEYDDETFTILMEDTTEDYLVNLTISDIDLADDEDTLTVNWNTYLAGKHADEDNDSIFWSENATVTMEDETPIAEDFRLETDLYFAQLFEDPDDPRIGTANIQIVDRFTGEPEVSIAPFESFDPDEATIDEILDNSSDFNDVAMNDSLVFTWEVSGVFGYFMDEANRSADPSDRQFGENVSFSADFEDAPQRYQPTDETHFNETSPGVAVLFDEDENLIVVTVNTSAQPGDIDVNQDWTATFTVDSDIADDEEVTEFETLERTFEFQTHVDGVDTIHVVPEENATIYGSTTIAPGSEIEGELDFRPIAFESLGPVEVEVVDGERVWVFTEDFSDYADNLDEEFEITATGPDAGDEETIDGVWNMTHELDRVSETAQLEAQIADLEAQIADLEGQLGDKDAEIAELEDEISALEGQVASLTADLGDAVDERDDAIAERDAAQEDLADAEDRIADLEADLEQAEGERDDAQSELDEWRSAAGEHDVDSPDELRERLDDAQPGFGAIAALLAILAGGALVARRRL